MNNFEEHLAKVLLESSMHATAVKGKARRDAKAQEKLDNFNAPAHVRIKKANAIAANIKAGRRKGQDRARFERADARARQNLKLLPSLGNAVGDALGLERIK
jgi:hypothetical protein